MAQRSLTQRDLLNRQIDQRETLYSDFIKEAARLHANSMTNNLKTLDELVSPHALVSRIRLVSSEPVLLAAEAFVRQIVRQYGEPNLSVEELRAAVLSANGEPLDVFSIACRKEIQDILRWGAQSGNAR